MQKRAYLNSRRTNEWPAAIELERIFLSAKKQDWLFAENDGASLTIDGLYETANLPSRDQVTVILYMMGNPTHGVYLLYSRWDGRNRSKIDLNSKGDLSRLGEFVRSMHGDRISAGLFIPIDAAWLAVREFMELDGELPKSVEWIASKDLPPEAFPPL